MIYLNKPQANEIKDLLHSLQITVDFMTNDAKELEFDSNCIVRARELLESIVKVLPKQDFDI